MHLHHVVSTLETCAFFFFFDKYGHTFRTEFRHIYTGEDQIYHSLRNCHTRTHLDPCFSESGANVQLSLVPRRAAAL